MKMPEPDRAALAQRESVIALLRKILPADAVITDPDELKVYESDGLTAYRQLPMIVALPGATEQVSRILSLCHQRGIKVVP
ncbi:MAG: FAD-binding oxidoreductase, partial [Proteobacteria bacterium]|nr:FAD-binding oxidoreductase [Pseudomonadota bacterium]